jgi:hypothetical protein
LGRPENEENDRFDNVGVEKEQEQKAAVLEHVHKAIQENGERGLPMPRVHAEEGRTNDLEKDSIRVNHELDSNEIDERDSQLENHDDPRISTFRGISIDSSDEDESASDSIRVNRACESNVIISLFCADSKILLKLSLIQEFMPE